MSENDFISVCTPVFNGEKFLEECIKGVLSQRYDNFEYIIVDNASTDRTPEIIEKYRAKDSRIKVFRNEITVPVIDNFNTCARHCFDSAVWIKYALADDYLYENCLEEMVRVGKQSEDIGLVSAYRLYGSQLTNVGLSPDQAVFKGADILKQQLLRKMHVCSGSPNTVLYRKSAFDAVNRFDNTYLHADTDLALRLLDAYDLGFAHCVFTKTGLHDGRLEPKSIATGLVIREYLDFGFKRLSGYKTVDFNDKELDSLSVLYAKQVDEFLTKRIARLDFKHIRIMLASCPNEVKRQMSRAFVSNIGKNVMIFVKELARVARRK